MPAITTYSSKTVGIVDVAYRVTLSGTLPTCGTPPVRCSEPNVWVAVRTSALSQYESVEGWNGPDPGAVQPPTSYDPTTGAIVIEFNVSLSSHVATKAEYLVIIQCAECPMDISTVVVPSGPPPKKK